VSVVFGTDGIRGVANEELTTEIVLALGRAAARHLSGGSFLIGRDTRRSGTMLAAALAAGLASEGVDVLDVGVLPTPAISLIAQRRDLPAAVVSASHNPFTDNGVKLLARGGMKLSDPMERAIEAELDQLLAESRFERPGPAGAGVGVIAHDASAAEQYLSELLSSVRLDLSSLRVVIDCANGASSGVAPQLFGHLGVELTVLFAQPDGCNINAGCGSTHPEHLAAEVLARSADLGLAFDGDADRLIAVDELGRVVDGDQLIALFAAGLKAAGRLRNEAVAVTVMSNLGLHLALREQGIGIIETPVGDRHVVDALETNDLVLGGEQSGHIVFREEAGTGDGLRSALRLLELVVDQGRPLSELADGAMTRMPQVLRTVGVRERRRLGQAREVWAEVAAVEEELSGRGRVLVRASGTEEAVRVMVEAESLELADLLVGRLERIVVSSLGGEGH
jgi:phosphoglucosamine mutase